MGAKQLTPMQIELLKMFNFQHDDELVIELRKVIGDYLQTKIDLELNKLWENGKLNQETLNSIRNEDLHQLMRNHRGSVSN